MPREHGGPLPDEHQATLVHAMALALERRSERVLGVILLPDVTAHTDGGGAVRTSIVPVEGAPAVADLLLRLFGRQDGIALTEESVNGMPALVARDGGAVVAVCCVEIAGPVVRRVFVQLNPDKLRHWATPAQPLRSPSTRSALS